MRRTRRAPGPRPAALLLGAALALTGCASDGPSAPQATIDADVVTLDGDPANLTDFTGSPLVVNFFAESCAPCVAEMPMFERVANDVDGAVTFVGVSEDATAGAARRIIEETGVTYAIVWDSDGSALIGFSGLGLPTTLFVDADGQVVESHTGALSEDDLRALMAEHL